MINRWNDVDERQYKAQCNDRIVGATAPGRPFLTENDILLQSYATTLLGMDNDLTMHGGGNTSVKKDIIDDSGNKKRALYVKSTGTPLNRFIPEYFVVMDQDFLEGLQSCGGLDDETMAREFKNHQLIPSDRLPSIESLMHAFIPAKFVSHTHPAAILKIVNRIDGRELLKKCFDDELAVVEFAKMGYDTAKAVSESAWQNSNCAGVVMRHHGLVTWGEDARETYSRTIDIITKAEEFLAKIFTRPIAQQTYKISNEVSIRNYELIAPAIKEVFPLSLRDMGKNEYPADKISLALLNTEDVLDLVNSPDGKNIINNPPMTPDYPMLTRILPLWVDDVDLNGAPEEIFSSVKKSVDEYVANYKNHLKSRGITNAPPTDLIPQAIIHPQTGAICFGRDNDSARKTADFTRQAFSIRRAIYETNGVYENLPEEHLFDMQYRGYQQPKKRM